MPDSPFDLLPLGSWSESGNPSDRASLERLQQDLRRLAERQDRIVLAQQALWELLREKAGLTDDDLARRMRDIDLRDGVADNRMTPVPVVCPACQRHSTSRREECLYCGSRLPQGPLLERL